MVSIGPRKYKSKTEAVATVRELLKQLVPREIKVGEEHFDFFSDLLANHPEQAKKVGCGVFSFIIKKNAKNTSANATDICRLDGSIEDFSWKKCAECAPGDTEDQKLEKALREAVEPFTRAFRQRSIQQCAKCGRDDLPANKFHVDHHTPSFHSILVGFKKWWILSPHPTSFDSAESNAPCFKESDSLYKQIWVNYHNERAQYQMLCYRCNLKKGCK